MLAEGVEAVPGLFYECFQPLLHAILGPWLCLGSAFVAEVYRVVRKMVKALGMNNYSYLEVRN